MSTRNRDSVDIEIDDADISADVDATVTAETGAIDAQSEHGRVRLRHEHIDARDCTPQASAFCFEGDELATLSLYMGTDEQSYATVGLDAEGCRQIAAQLLRCAAELDADDE